MDPAARRGEDKLFARRTTNIGFIDGLVTFHMLVVALAAPKTSQETNSPCAARCI